MVGGGRDAFIGGVHRMAMRLDGKIELVAGAFSSNPEKAKLSGEDLLLDPKRVYADYRTMANEESRYQSGPSGYNRQEISLQDKKKRILPGIWP